MEKSKESKQYKMMIVIAMYWIIVIIGKIIRYTILKKTLVSMSIGNGWIDSLNSGLGKFIFSLEGDSVASENSKAIFQIFRYLGFSTYVEYEFIITIIWNVIFILILFTLKNKLTFPQMIFIMMSIAVLNIWDFCVAKEPLQMFYFIAIYVILISKHIKEKIKYPLSMLVILFSCISYRNYYILVAAFSIFSYVSINKFIIRNVAVKWYDILKIMFLFAILYMLVIIYCEHFNTEAYESFMYFNQRVTKAKTDLSSLFHSNILPVIAIDYMILVIRMLFPIELIKFGPQYWLYAVYQVLISIYLIKAFKNLKSNGRIKNLALYIYLGFLFASATFEPDFGSWVRHEAVALPIILIVADLFNEEKLKMVKENDYEE